MKVSLILKIVGALHIAIGGMMLGMLIFSVETMVASTLEPVTPQLLMAIRGFADVVAASQLGIGLLLIICSYIKDLSATKMVLLGEVALMTCALCVATFNTLNSGTIVDGGPPPPFWLILIINPSLCIYGYLKGK